MLIEEGKDEMMCRECGWIAHQDDYRGPGQGYCEGCYRNRLDHLCERAENGIIDLVATLDALRDLLASP